MPFECGLRTWVDGSATAKIYANYEQSEKPKITDPLTQAAIDRAFRGQQRESTFAFLFGVARIILLSGKKTNNAGVERINISSGATVSVTSLERTLIDITVRPKYAGGAAAVLESYKRAKERLSVPRLLNLLRKLDYRYPYHQAVGFYMARAGYPADHLMRVRQFRATEFDFYLAHGLNSKALDKEWRICYPRGL